MRRIQIGRGSTGVLIREKSASHAGTCPPTFGRMVRASPPYTNDMASVATSAGNCRTLRNQASSG